MRKVRGVIAEGSAPVRMDRVVVGRTVLALSKLGGLAIALGFGLCLSGQPDELFCLNSPEPPLLQAFDMMKWDTQYRDSTRG
ncbi:MAG TPA: hypothetical protein V6D20_13280 [Candidatus Obscuribacterales bacterium]